MWLWYRLEVLLCLNWLETCSQFTMAFRGSDVLFSFKYMKFGQFTLINKTSIDFNLSIKNPLEGNWFLIFSSKSKGVMRIFSIHKCKFLMISNKNTLTRNIQTVISRLFNWLVFFFSNRNFSNESYSLVKLEII